MTLPVDATSVMNDIESTLAEIAHAYSSGHPAVAAANSDHGVRELVRLQNAHLTDARYWLTELLLVCARNALGRTYLAQYCSALLDWAVGYIRVGIFDPVPDSLRGPMADRTHLTVADIAVRCARPAELLDMLIDRLNGECAAYRAACGLIEDSSLTLDDPVGLDDRARSFLNGDRRVPGDKVWYVAQRAIGIYENNFRFPRHSTV